MVTSIIAQFEVPGNDPGRTRWSELNSDHYVRRTINLQAADLKEDLYMIYSHDDVFELYINGTKVASTDYGYVGLEADLTKHLKWGEANEVKVYASTGSKGGSRWYTGGGLFRDVYMKLENPTHIARHGVFVRIAPLRHPRVTLMSSRTKL